MTRGTALENMVSKAVKRGATGRAVMEKLVSGAFRRRADNDVAQSKHRKCTYTSVHAHYLQGTMH